tara:strand:- start:16109 stop:17191 length:1083 start_codon:yes stop_codon:yes gene_type:complete
MKKIKICILGTGFASIAYLPALNTISQVKINSIYGRNYSVLKKLSKKYKIQNIYTDIKDLLDNCNDDLYCNVLPPKQQFDYSKEILRRKKKPILCEKPFTSSYNNAKKLGSLFLKNNVDCFVNYQMRFQPLRFKIKKILEKKQLGNILNVNLNYDFSSRLYSDFKYNWWSNKSLGGGVLNAMGSHQIDLLVWLFGKAEKVFGVQNNYLKFRKTKKNKKLKVTSDDISKFVLFFKKFNINISISSVSIGWKTSCMSIYGDKAALFLDGENNLRLMKKTKFDEQEYPKVIDYSKRDELFKHKWIDNSIWRASFFRQIKEIITYLKNNKKKKYRGANFKDAIYVRKIIQKIEQSNKTGKILKI